MEVEQVATAMNEMAATVQEMARNANAASEAAHRADQESNDGRQVVFQAIDAIESLSAGMQKAVDAIQALSSTGEQIGSIVDVIGEIARPATVRRFKF